MKHLALMALVMASVALGGCRIGGAFESDKGVSSIDKGTKTETTTEVKATDTDETEEPTDPAVKSIPDPIVYLTPAG